MTVGPAKVGQAWAGLALALAAVAATSILSIMLLRTLNLASLALLFIVPVMFSAARAGLGAGMAAAAAAALAFNFLLVEPRFAWRIADPDNVATTLLLFLVAAVVSHLAGQLRRAKASAEAAMRDEQLLTRLAQGQSDLDADQLVERLRTTLADRLAIETVVVPPDGDVGSAASLDRAAASWALTQREPAGCGTVAIAGADRMFVPIVSDDTVIALLSLRAGAGAVPLPSERAPFLRRALAITERALGQLATRRAQAAFDTARQRHALGSALLSSVGHDLRTPLTVILGEARAMMAADPARREPVAIAMEGERLRRRIDNLLGMARIEGGAVIVANEPIDLADAVASALDDAMPAMGERALTVALPSDLPLVRADPGLLHHVLLNLIDNAVKFSHGPVEIGARAMDEAVELTIADRGPGLPVGREQEAFERFRRFAGSDRTGGTGLGLAIAQAFSQAFGAHVSARNRQRGGAAFTIRFPLSR